MSNSALTSHEDQEDKGNQEGDGGDDSKKGSEKDDAEDDDEEGYEYSFRVYYRKEEIRMANAMQGKDQFEDLITMRHNTIIENQENPPNNKFNIMDFTPREKSPATSIAKKKSLKSGIGQKKKGMILGFDEEEEDQNFDEFLADYEKKKKETDDAAMTEQKLHELEKANLENEIKTLIKIRDT